MTAWCWERDYQPDAKIRQPNGGRNIALATMNKLDGAQCRKIHSLEKHENITHHASLSIYQLLKAKYSGIRVTEQEFVCP